MIESIVFVCPSRTWIYYLALISHTLHTESLPPVTITSKVGCNAMQ